MSKKCTFITQFNRDVSQIQKANVVKFDKPSKVKQSLSYATDINTIYDNYCRTGRVPLNGNQPIYDENFVKYDDLIAAQKLVSEASLYFQTLPANIRSQYGNSLEKFVNAVHSKDDYLLKEGVLQMPLKEVVEGPIVDLPSVDIPSQPVQTPVTE